MNRIQIIIALLLAWVLVLPTLVAAQERSDKANASRLDDWQSRMEQADAWLLEGKYRKARRQANDLADEMVNEILTGDAKPLLATVSLLRAIAEAGLGNEREAFWDLHVARSLDEKIGSTSLAAYGEVGDLLSEPQIYDWEKDDHGSHPKNTPIEPPRKKKEPQPKYPLGKRYKCLEDSVVLLSVIDRKGLPQKPKILSAQDAVLGFVALQSLRDWRFEPARIDGKPVAVYYNLQVNFHVPRCPTS